MKEVLDSNPRTSVSGFEEYRIGAEDVLEINVFSAPELNRQVRVSEDGDISLPLLGEVRAAGLTPIELESSLQELLRRRYMKDPHVSVFVREMQSHSLSVIGAVRRPGTFQVRGPKTLLETLSLAEGLSDDAGDTVIIMHGAGVSKISGSDSNPAPAPVESSSSAPNLSSETPASSLHRGASSVRAATEINLKDLLNSADPDYNPLVSAGDIVKVPRAGIVYVLGEVRKPGGFALKSNDRISVLQAIALSEGLTRTAAKTSVRVIRTDPRSGERKETTINLAKVMTGKAADPMLEPKDIVFVPDSAARTTFSRTAEAAAQTLTGLLIFHW